MSDRPATETARKNLERAETGDTNAAAQLNNQRDKDPAGTEAAEQEASDGPPGRGLAR